MPFARYATASDAAVDSPRGVAVLRVVLYAVISLVFLIPFIWMIFGSLRRETEIFQYLFPFSWHTFFPIEWTLEHYRDIFGLSEAGQRAGLNFGRNLMNSFIVSTGVVISSLVFNTMGAYFFARLKFPKKNWLLAFVLVTLFVPFEVTMVPLYIVVRISQLAEQLLGDDRPLVRQPVRDLRPDPVLPRHPVRPGRGGAARRRELSPHSAHDHRPAGHSRASSPSPCSSSSSSGTSSTGR